jgi:hypothetical protein
MWKEAVAAYEYLRVQPGIFLTGPEENYKIPQYSRCLGRDLKPGLSKYEAGVRPPRLRRSVLTL